MISKMNKKIPLRQCIGCGEMKNKKEMMRILKTPEGPIVLDVTGKNECRLSEKGKKE